MISYLAFSLATIMVGAALVSEKRSNRKIARLEAENNRLLCIIGQDKLTNLCSRSAFDTCIEQVASNTEKYVYLMVIDLDGFKAINDTFGHAIGDEVLQAVGKRLQSALKGSDCVARMGGDEFVAVLSSDTQLVNIGDIGDRLIKSINRPIQLRGQATTVTVGASVGIVERTMYDDTHHDELFEYADKLMYRVKQNGKNSYLVEAVSGARR